MNRSPLQVRSTFVTALAMFLASCSCGAIYGGWSWLPTAFGTIVVVALASLLCRWIRIPLLMQPPVVAACLLVAATARFASDQAFGLVIPTGASSHELVQAYRYGIHDVTASTVPVSSNTNTLIVLVAGLALMAFSADLLAVGAGRPSLAGLPMLTILIVAAVLRHGGIGLLSFALAAAGYLLLLGLDSRDRVVRWGRILPPRTPQPTNANGSSSSRNIWRIGTATLSLAILLPIAIPGADHGHLGGSSGIGSGGSSSTTVVDPLVAIQSQLTSAETNPLLHVKTNVPTYQRLTALDKFDGNGFTLAPLSAESKDKVSGGGLSHVALPPTATTVKETITAEERLTQAFLPIPQNPTAIRVDGDWRISQPTGTVFSSHTTTSGKTWTVTGAVPAPSQADLETVGAPDPSSYPADIRAADLELPRNIVPRVVRDTAVQWIRDANATTTYDIANAIQSKFTSGDFAYDTSVTITAGPGGFAQFLQMKRGYCQQYATTMVAMLRTLGIPARVAIGFTQGTLEQDGSYTITNKDAHAWPEVWFNKIGWVRFEPTPLAAGHALVPSYTAAPAGRSDAGTVSPSTSPSATPTATPSANATTTPTPGNGTDGTTGSSISGGRVASIIGWGALGLLAAVTIGAIPWVARWWRRRSRWRSAMESVPELVEVRAAEAAWADVMEDASDRGLSVPRSASPRRAGQLLLAALALPPAMTQTQTARTNAGRIDHGLVDEVRTNERSVDTLETSDAIKILVSAIERARYGHTTAGTSGPAPTELRQAANVLSRQLADTQEGMQRLVVTLFPPSARRFWIVPLFDASRSAGRVIDLGLARGEELLRRGRRSRNAPTG